MQPFSQPTTAREPSSGENERQVPEEKNDSLSLSWLLVLLVVSVYTSHGSVSSCPAYPQVPWDALCSESVTHHWTQLPRRALPRTQPHQQEAVTAETEQPVWLLLLSLPLRGTHPTQLWVH